MYHTTLEEIEMNHIPPVDNADLNEESAVTEESLIEEISIDGMCGVY